MPRIEASDLAQVDLNDLDREDVLVGGSPPPRRRGPKPSPSRWLTFVRLADEAANGATEVEEIDGENHHVGPWVQYPKTNEPLVWSKDVSAVRKVFGPGGEYATTHDGDYFDITLRDTVAPGTNTKGVLWVRKVVVSKRVVK